MLGVLLPRRPLHNAICGGHVPGRAPRRNNHGNIEMRLEEVQPTLIQRAGLMTAGHGESMHTSVGILAALLFLQEFGARQFHFSHDARGLLFHGNNLPNGLAHMQL